MTVAESLLFGDAVAELLLWIEQQKPWSDLAFFVLAARLPLPNAGADHLILDASGNAVLLWPLGPDSLASAAPHGPARATAAACAARFDRHA